MASTDALPIPRKNAAYRVYFPVLKNDGTIVTGWTSPAASISKDGATAASATNTPTEIASSFGIGYLDLTSTEMNADAVIVKATVTNTGGLAQVIVLYPQEAGDIQVNPTYWNGQAVAAPNVNGVPLVDLGYYKGTASPTADTNGYPVVTVKHGTGTGEISLSSGVADANVAKWSGSAVATPDSAGYPKVTHKTGTGTGELDVSSGRVKLVDGTISAATFATDALDANALKADAASEIASAVVAAVVPGGAASNTVGGKLNSAGAAGDPLASDVPGSYAAGTAGWYFGQLSVIRDKALLITADNVAFTTPTNPLTGDLTLVRGDDYTVTSGRALPEWSSADWTPFSLTTATNITLRARTRYSETVFTKAAAALSNTQVRVALTAAETATFAVGRDAYSFDLEAVLASGDVVTLAQGKISILEDVQ